MSSGIFSSCCDAFQSVDNSQAYATKISRNIYKKNKTCNIVTSPKSSLKNQNNNKTIKSPEDSVRQQNILLTSTVNVAQFSKTQNFAKRIQVNKPEVSFLKVPFVQKVVYLNRTRPPLLTPSPIKQPTSARTVHIQKVNFSYNNSKNKQRFPTQPTTSPFTHITIPSLIQKISPRTIQKVESNNKDQGKLIQSKIISQLPKEIGMNQRQSQESNLPFQQILELENRNSLPTNIFRGDSKLQKQQERKQVKENRKTAPQGLVFDKYLLGGSKFTVLSQEQVEQVNEQKQLRLEQSAILVNVFNPTSSQMKNWEVKKSKASQIQQLNSNRK